MRPVVQTETDLGRGNCMAACMASIMELSITDVPNFRLDPNPWAALQSWLMQCGLYAFKVPADTTFDPMPSTHVVLIGDSPRHDNVYHAVVGRLTPDGWQVVHDPHPLGGGLNGSPKWVILVGAFCG